MNQNNSDQNNELPKISCNLLPKNSQYDNFSDIIKSNNENSYSDEVSKDEISGNHISSQI